VDIAFIDFDDAKYGESVIDISILIALFFVSSKIGVDLDGIRYFIDLYYGDDVVLKNEESCFIKQRVSIKSQASWSKQRNSQYRNKR